PGRPRADGRGGAHGGAGVDCELQPADNSANGGALMTDEQGFGMRSWGLVAVLAIAGACAPAPQTSNTPAAGAEMPRAIVDPYLKIQAALADDSTEGVHANAGGIVTAATALGSPAMKIDTAAIQLAAASEAE